MATPSPQSIASQPRLALLGTGLMGSPIARRLCKAGFELSVWNRTVNKALALKEDGALVASSAAQAVAAADIVVILLTDGDAVSNLLFEQGVADAIKAGSLVVDMSSIKPAQARNHAKRLAELAQGPVWHLDAPVSGGTVGAEQGSLAIMVGGEATAFERALPVFGALGRATHVGPGGAGQLAKLANQMIVGITIGAVAEALLLCEKGGANMAQVRAAIAGGFADSRILQIHGQRMVERDFAKRGAMTVQLKDMRNALDTAKELGFDAPISTLLEHLYGQAVENGLHDLDHSGLFVELAQRNGLK